MKRKKTKTKTYSEIQDELRVPKWRVEVPGRMVLVDGFGRCHAVATYDPNKVKR